jgi:hypothetical protein
LEGSGRFCQVGDDFTTAKDNDALIFNTELQGDIGREQAAHFCDGKADFCGCIWLAVATAVYIGLGASFAGGVHEDDVVFLIIDEEIAVDERLVAVDGGQIADRGVVEQGADPFLISYFAVASANGGQGAGGVIY